MGQVIHMKSPIKYECPGCHAEASCNCGLPPILKAESAVRDNPNRSDREIARAIGVHYHTVGKARKSSGDKSPNEARISKDGRRRSAPKRSAAKALAAHRRNSPGPNEWQAFNRELTLAFSTLEEWFNKLMAKEVPPSAEMAIMGLMHVSKITQNWGYRLNEKTGGSHDIEVPPCNR